MRAFDSPIFFSIVTGMVAIGCGAEEEQLTVDIGSEAVGVSAESEDDAELRNDAPASEITELTCHSQGVHIDGAVGSVHAVLCPANCANSRMIWGTGTYTDDSPVCIAAVHAGILSLDEGGAATVIIEPGADGYSGSTANGVITAQWNRSYERSFRFAP